MTSKVFYLMDFPHFKSYGKNVPQIISKLENSFLPSFLPLLSLIP